MNYPIRIEAGVDSGWRRSQASDAGPVADLESLMRVLLPLYVPVTLLEGFGPYRDMVVNLQISRPKVLYSASALHNHLIFKILAAEWREKGTLLLYHQHGGNYGIDKEHALEEFEIRNSDRFLTWGWRSKSSNVRPLSPAAMHSPNRLRKRVLLCCVELPRLVYRLQLIPMPGTIQTMHREILDFLAGLPSHMNLMIRPDPSDHGWGFTRVMQRSSPDAEFDDCRSSSFVRFAESRLVVHSYLATGWLETLALDIPTVCFFDETVYAFRKDSLPFIAALEQVGILQRSGKDAARFILSLGDNIEEWWKKPETQEARRNFVMRYANFSVDWARAWESEFRDAIETH